MQTANRGRGWRQGATALIATVLAVLALNALLSGVVARKDFTAERLYTLSDVTRRTLDKLTAPVTLKLFFSSSNPEVPVYLKNYGKRVEETLREYVLAGQDRIKLEVYDPEPDSDAEDWALRYGIAGQSLGYMGPNMYLGLAAVSGANEASLPLLDPKHEGQLEYQITRMLSDLSRTNKPVVGIMSSLPVLGKKMEHTPDGATPYEEEPWLIFQEIERSFEVRRLRPPLDRIPDDMDTVILIHPKVLDNAALYALDQFVLRGGRLLAFLDPGSTWDARAQEDIPFPYRSLSSDLPELLEAWGVRYDDHQVVGDWSAGTQLRAANNASVETPVWLTLRKGAFASNDVLTAQLEVIMLPYAGSFTVREAHDLTVTPLLVASDEAGKVEAVASMMGPTMIDRELQPAGMRLNLAVRLHGRLHTAFPDGPPEGADAPADGSLTQSVDRSTVILVGDSDMLMDEYVAQPVQFYGTTGYQPMNDNLFFVLNAVEQLAGDSDLIEVRSRGASDRAFDVVLDLMRRAQARYRNEERALIDQLEATQLRLEALKQQREPGQSAILTAEQKAAIERFREQEYETKQALKRVRRELRREIERLGAWLKALNTFVVPLAVVAAALVYGALRRRAHRRRARPKGDAA